MYNNYKVVTNGVGYAPNHRERRQGAGLSFLSPNRLPKGGLRRSDGNVGRLGDYSHGGVLYG